MSNMSYCRFYNTAIDLADCLNHLADDLTGDEAEARKRLISLCNQIVEETEGRDFDDVDEDDDAPVPAEPAQPAHPVVMSDSMYRTVELILKTDGLIPAVKAVREEYGCSLKDAKATVDAIRAQS